MPPQALALLVVLALGGFGVGFLAGGGTGGGTAPPASAAPGPERLDTGNRAQSIAAPGSAGSLPALVKKRTPRHKTPTTPPRTTVPPVTTQPTQPTQPPRTVPTQPPPTHPPTTTF
jgi:hypothetical protein